MAQFVLNTLTLLNINRFSKFFHCLDQEKICNNIITKDPTTPQVCRNTTLWNVRKSWFRLACQEWVRLASSSSSQEPRLTANITVNMFSVAVYCLTSVQDTSATPGPCSKTVHRHTVLGTHWRTCDVRMSRSSSLTCGPQQPGLDPVDYAVWGALQQMSINVDDSGQSTSYSRRSSLSGENCCSVSLIAPLVSSVAGLSASSSSKADTLNIWCKKCMMWQLL